MLMKHFKEKFRTQRYEQFIVLTSRIFMKDNFINTYRDKKLLELHILI